MLRYLNGESNVKGAPERELRPRVRGALHARREPRHHGREELQRERRARSSRSRSPAGTSTTPNPDNAKALFDSGRWFNGPKSSSASSATTTPTSVVDLVLAPATATRPTSSTSCGASSCPRRRRPRRCRSCRPTTSASGRKIKPLLRADPHRPAAVRVDRRAEHDQAAGRLRQSAHARARRSASRLLAACRLPRRDGPGPLLPADGGGLGGRPLVAQHEHRAGALRLRRAASARADRSPAKVVDVPGETPAGGLRPCLRARWARRGCRPGTRTAIQRLRRARPDQEPASDRIERQLMLRTLMLAGPDAQVM